MSPTTNDSSSDGNVVAAAVATVCVCTPQFEGAFCAVEKSRILVDEREGGGGSESQTDPLWLLLLLLVFLLAGAGLAVFRRRARTRKSSSFLPMNKGDVDLDNLDNWRAAKHAPGVGGSSPMLDTGNSIGSFSTTIQMLHRNATNNMYAPDGSAGNASARAHATSMHDYTVPPSSRSSPVHCQGARRQTYAVTPSPQHSPGEHPCYAEPATPCSPIRRIGRLFPNSPPSSSAQRHGTALPAYPGAPPVYTPPVSPVLETTSVPLTPLSPFDVTQLSHDELNLLDYDLPSPSIMKPQVSFVFDRTSKSGVRMKSVRKDNPLYALQNRNRRISQLPQTENISHRASSAALQSQRMNSVASGAAGEPFKATAFSAVAVASPGQNEHCPPLHNQQGLRKASVSASDLVHSFTRSPVRPRHGISEGTRPVYTSSLAAPADPNRNDSYMSVVDGHLQADSEDASELVPGNVNTGVLDAKQERAGADTLFSHDLDLDSPDAAFITALSHTQNPSPIKSRQISLRRASTNLDDHIQASGSRARSIFQSKLGLTAGLVDGTAVVEAEARAMEQDEEYLAVSPHEQFGTLKAHLVRKGEGVSTVCRTQFDANGYLGIQGPDVQDEYLGVGGTPSGVGSDRTQVWAELPSVLRKTSLSSQDDEYLGIRGVASDTHTLRGSASAQDEYLGVAGVASRGPGGCLGVTGTPSGLDNEGTYYDVNGGSFHEGSSTDSSYAEERDEFDVSGKPVVAGSQAAGRNSAGMPPQQHDSRFATTGVIRPRLVGSGDVARDLSSHPVFEHFDDADRAGHCASAVARAELAGESVCVGLSDACREFQRGNDVTWGEQEPVDSDEYLALGVRTSLVLGDNREVPADSDYLTLDARRESAACSAFVLGAEGRQARASMDTLLSLDLAQVDNDAGAGALNPVFQRPAMLPGYASKQANEFLPHQPQRAQGPDAASNGDLTFSDATRPEFFGNRCRTDSTAGPLELPQAFFGLRDAMVDEVSGGIDLVSLDLDDDDDSHYTIGRAATEGSAQDQIFAARKTVNRPIVASAEAGGMTSAMFRPTTGRTFGAKASGRKFASMARNVAQSKTNV